ncbi:hypothetical protein [Ketogulonicigenium vulgare]|uniref:hypothetical protein n=1 Tax=Ketogulonicigenium vulgare TaxID=92945 RepID=UPI0023594E93|nr:hypothetical protein [Ketogulonicigenium vulgare]
MKAPMSISIEKCSALFALATSVALASPTLAQDAQSELARQIEATARTDGLAQQGGISSSISNHSIEIDDCHIKLVEGSTVDYTDFQVHRLVTTEFDLGKNPSPSVFYANGIRFYNETAFTFSPYSPAMQQTIHNENIVADREVSEYKFFSYNTPTLVAMFTEYKELYCNANS